MAKLILNGSTSGSVTLESPAVSGTTTLTLPTTSGTVLTSASNTGFPAGSILQVVQATYSTATSTTSATFTDSGLSASITPSSSSNTILIIVNQHIRVNKATDCGYGFRLVRGSTAIFTRDDGSTAAYLTASDLRFPNTMVYLDSPSSTSSTTYKTQINSYNSSTVNAQHSSIPSTITLMEIKG